MPLLRQKRKAMTIETLFGKEEVTSKPRTIKFKQIKAVLCSIRELQSLHFIVNKYACLKQKIIWNSHQIGLNLYQDNIGPDWEMR
jgi:hypothetical protein